MSTKNIIISLVGVIIIGTAVYFLTTREHLSIEATTLPPVQITKTGNLTTEEDPVKEPAATSSTDTRSTGQAQKDLTTSLHIEAHTTGTSTKAGTH